MSKRHKRVKKLHTRHGWGAKGDPVFGRYSLREWLRRGAPGIPPFSPEWHLCEEYAAQKHIFVVPF